MTPEDIVESFKKKFGENIVDARIEKRAVALKKNEYVHLWIKVHRDVFKDAVRHLFGYNFPHLAVVSGNDVGDEIELIYHFTIFYGEHLKEILINLVVPLPKKDLRIPTICDLIPGALITEREKQDMFGVIVEDIPDNRRLFLPDDFPEGVYPWRKDETGIKEEMVHKLYKEAEEVGA